MKRQENTIAPPRRGVRRKQGAGKHDLRPNRERQRGQVRRAAISREMAA